MCRSIKPLFNFTPPTTDEDVRAAALQFVRKVADTRKPSKQNQAAFDAAVEEVYQSTRRLLDTLVASTPPRDRVRFESLKRLRFEKAAQRRG